MNNSDIQELAPAWEMLEQNDPQGAMVFAGPYLDAARSEIREEAEKVIGLALFGLGDYQDAASRLAVVAERSDEHADWFNFATAATMAGEIVRGEEAMRRAIETAKGSTGMAEPSIPYMRLYYAHALADVEEYERALEQLNALREAYRWFPSSDPDYLTSRGIPPLATMMIPAVKVLVGLGEGVDMVGWLEGFAATLDEPGKELIAHVLAELPREGSAELPVDSPE